MDASKTATVVCVTGGAGYLGSWIVKTLLLRGYTVHVTVRNLGDESKVGMLRSMPNADKGLLRLFQADLYGRPSDFDKAIQGCHYVLHLATPFHHQPDPDGANANSHASQSQSQSQFRGTTDAAVAGMRTIVESCIRSGTVKRLVYTASAVAASPIRDDANSYADQMDESCWTNPNSAVSLPHSTDFLMAYVRSKTAAERELLNHEAAGKLEIVRIACGIVGGDTLLSSIGGSFAVLSSQWMSDRMGYQALRFLEELLGKLPVVHVEDVCEAHIFCMLKPSLTGRFLCASDYVKSSDIAHYLQKKQHPHIGIAKEFIEDTGREIVWGSSKLKDLGFVYKHDLKTLLDDSIRCAMKMGHLAASTS